MAAGQRRRYLIILLLGLLHAGAYAWFVTPWQAPDEPGHLEYACLLGSLGRVPQAGDRSPALQAEIIASLAANDFWPRVREPWPDPLPDTFPADPFLARSGRQIGDEPPLYYLAPALICRGSTPVVATLRFMRLFGALLFAFTGVAAAWAYRGAQSAPGRAETDAPPAALSALHAAVIVLLPMAAFIAGSANNDALAMLTATALFAAVLRAQRLGLTWQRSAAIVLLLVLALLSKKTNAFLLPWLALLALVYVVGRVRQRSSPMARRRWALGLTLLLLPAVVVALLPSAAPAAWRGRHQPPGRGLLPATAGAPAPEGGRIVEIVDRSPRAAGRLYQSVVGEEAHALRGQTVQASAWVRSPDDRPRPGRLTVLDASGYTQLPFVAGVDWQRVALSHTVALTTTYVKLTLAPGGGTAASETTAMLVDDVALSGRDGKNRLRNGGFEQPARWGELLLVAPLEARWQQFAPRLTPAARTAEALERYSLYLALTFAGFWGNYGWLQHPLPVWVYALLALACLAALIGLVRASAARRWTAPWLLAVALVAVQTFLPMVGRDWQPQGRYLFPALFPLAGLLLVGLDHWLDLSGRPGRRRALLIATAGFALLGLIWAILGA